VPDSIDVAQYGALKEFREWCESQGIIETFFESEEFKSKLTRQLQIAIQKNDYLRGIVLSSQTSSALESAPSGPSLALSGLSPEAKQLLAAAAADSSGAITTFSGLNGRFIQAGNKTFGDPQNRREMAKWDYGLEQLITLDLIRRDGDVMNPLTELGYRTAERLKS
jgi:hypothetical protein